ncbi:hypothetical protein [Nocardia abscessus]|uniref:hypothetical protein n=1 Tax=Nocardia abscessus TaxID=120957 RepID=UPI002454EDC4|nr:hypothetical protein [Nocardia abscessus]
MVNIQLPQSLRWLERSGWQDHKGTPGGDRDKPKVRSHIVETHMTGANGTSSGEPIAER